MISTPCATVPELEKVNAIPTAFLTQKLCLGDKILSYELPKTFFNEPVPSSFKTDSNTSVKYSKNHNNLKNVLEPLTYFEY